MTKKDYHNEKEVSRWETFCLIIIPMALVIISISIFKIINK